MQDDCDASPMTRTLTITAAEWASVQDGTLWLVREGVRQYVGLKPMPASPPAEFVQACAPLTKTCRGRCEFHGACRPPIECPDCRIELVGACPRGLICADGYDHSWCGTGTPPCNDGTVTLGYGYAVGEPLPICHLTQPRTTPNLVATPSGITCNPANAPYTAPDLTDRLAHYGPPESLVGKWALQVEVVA